MKTIIPSVKGTRDFYPEEMAIRIWLYQKIRQVSESFGYQEYEAPFLEKIDLYAAKSGEELVKEQAFVFPDRGGDLITLRPELTPSLARMVAQKQNELAFPLRWWSFGPFWRYEKPQRGRTREFFQWNIDLIGPNTPEVDAELVAICATFFQNVGLTPDKVVILVNDRRLMDAEVAGMGIPPEKRGDVFRLIDKRDKMRLAEWEAYAMESGFTPGQLEQLKRLLADPDLWKKSPELARFFAALEALGMRDYVQFDSGVIRGLLYYTGTVFEARERQEGGRAILGGGRYDNLVSDVGGTPVYCVGFAMGDVMITLVLKGLGLLPTAFSYPAQVLVTTFDDTLLLPSLSLASGLRRAGINAVSYPEPAKLQKQFKYADRVGIRFVVIMGPDEEKEGKVTVKDLASGVQETIQRDCLARKLGEFLAAVPVS
ncbi:MAG TPA: histidine--tRNA ligase [Anaerolineaceae bacterium]|nr:histidine--tRNA ligase [Anaerolineaceae bacterium]